MIHHTNTLTCMRDCRYIYEQMSGINKTNFPYTRSYCNNLKVDSVDLPNA